MDKQPKQVFHESSTKISELKIYLGKLTKVDTVQITFNSDLKIFIIKNIGSMSLKDVEDLSVKNPINNYVDGKPL